MNYEKIFQPKINPFRLYIYSLKENSIILKTFSQEKIISSKLSKLNSSFSYCNSFNNLFISEGNNFWIINHSSFQIKYKKMPIQKTRHSLLFIPNEDGKIFIIGGKDKKSFYYDLKKNYFLNWAEINFIHINPALIRVGDYLYIIDTNKNNNKIIFERTKLTDKKKSWEIIEPKYDINIINNFPNEFFGVSLDSKGNIIFLGGNNINMENNTTYVYNINENRILLSNQGTNDNMIFKDSSFYFYDNNYNVALPENLDEIKEIAFVDKNEQSLIKTNIDETEKKIKYNYNNINNKNVQIRQKKRIIINENIPNEYGYCMSSYSSTNAKMNAKKNKIDVIEANKIIVNIPINKTQKIDNENEIKIEKIQKEKNEIKIEENYVEHRLEEQEQNNIIQNNKEEIYEEQIQNNEQENIKENIEENNKEINNEQEIIQDNNIKEQNLNINNNIQYEEINTDIKPNEENINQKYEEEEINNIEKEENIEQEEINNNNIKEEQNIEHEENIENFEQQENKIEGEEKHEELEEHFEQEEKEYEQDNEQENINEQKSNNENENYEEHQQQVFNEQENEQIENGEENYQEQEQEQNNVEQQKIEQEQEIKQIEKTEEKNKEKEQHYEEQRETNVQDQEQEQENIEENNQEQYYEENKDINIHEQVQEQEYNQEQENKLENELNDLNQKENTETLETHNELENQHQTEEKHSEKENEIDNNLNSNEINIEQNQQSQEKNIENNEEQEIPMEIDIEKLEKRLDNIMNKKLEDGNIKLNEVITSEIIKDSNNEITIQKNTDINIVEGDEKVHIEIKEQTTPLTSQEKSPNVFISGEENVEEQEEEHFEEQNENSEIKNEEENVEEKENEIEQNNEEEEENGEYEEQEERDTLQKTITENIGADVMQIPEYLISYYNEENFCDYEP